MKTQLYKQELAKQSLWLRWAIHLKILTFRVTPAAGHGYPVRRYSKLNCYNPFSYLFILIAFIIMSVNAVREEFPTLFKEQEV